MKRSVLKRPLLLLGGLCLILWGLDRRYPMQLPESVGLYAHVVVDAEGRPLRSFADTQGVWRYPVTLEQVSPRYIEALLTYEDRWFWYHPGVNPLALARALWQALRYDEIVSGGSTLTMQVARRLYPHTRTLTGKGQQILRALQLERHLSKPEILTLYLNLAPFGGTIEGVQAASFAYLDKPASDLTPAEAALLAVLPQTPSRLRPDRHPQRAQAARDKVLRRMQSLNVWTSEQVADALQEPVYASQLHTPLSAALFSRRLQQRYPQHSLIQTTLDGALQHRLEDTLAHYREHLPPQSSLAVLVVRNRDMSVQAYAGTAEFGNEARFGYLDMVTGIRSPGSTLKPFLYGMAIEAGLIHSQSLLSDVPRDGQTYRPGNFSGGFSGPVSATEALQRSLNVPAVNLLEQFGAARFTQRWQQAGLTLQNQGEAGLALILGGTGTSLEQLVRAYSALANAGQVGELRYRPEDPQRWRYLLSPGSAWITAEMLRTRPEFLHLHSTQPSTQSAPIAWKTGTSYGFRDAWAVGVDQNYTVGVWVGRPDGTPMPGHFGAQTAAPLLFTLFQLLPVQQASPPPPASVQQQTICWPLGTLASQYPALCEQTHNAWILDYTVPPTPLNDHVITTNPLLLWVDESSQQRAPPGCQLTRPTQRTIALWPAALEPWLKVSQRRSARIPPLDPRCQEDSPLYQTRPQITGLEAGARITPTLDQNTSPQIPLQVVGGTGTVSWYVDGRFWQTSLANQVLHYQPDVAGEHEILVVDSQGLTDRKIVTLLR